VLAKCIFYSGLLLASLAMLLFVTGFASLQFDLTESMVLFYRLASNIMLLALVLLVLWGVVALCRSVGRDLRDYFNREAGALRRLLAFHTRRQDAEQRNILESRQLHYLSLFKRQRLLVADDRKHLRDLFNATNRELRAVRAQLPTTTYRSLHKALRNHYKHADVRAMLAFREQLPCR
jgi:hypothetical protein